MTEILADINVRRIVVGTSVDLDKGARANEDVLGCGAHRWQASNGSLKSVMHCGS